MSDDAVHRGDRLSRLYEEYYDYLVKYCMRRVGYAPELRSLAEDWSQDAFQVALIKGDAFLNHPNHRAWLIITCERKILHHIEKEKRRGTKRAYEIDAQDEPMIEDCNSRVDRSTERKEAASYLHEICEMMSDDEYAVYMDHFENELTVKDVAAKHGKSENAIKAAIRRIRRKARNFLNDKNS